MFRVRNIWSYKMIIRLCLMHIKYIIFITYGKYKEISTINTLSMFKMKWNVDKCLQGNIWTTRATLFDKFLGKCQTFSPQASLGNKLCWIKMKNYFHKISLSSQARRKFYSCTKNKRKATNIWVNENQRPR